MPEDLKLSQIGSSQPLPPFRGLHSPGVRKHCQIIFACYFLKSSISSRTPWFAVAKHRTDPCWITTNYTPSDTVTDRACRPGLGSSPRHTHTKKDGKTKRQHKCRNTLLSPNLRKTYWPSRARTLPASTLHTIRPKIHYSHEVSFPVDKRTRPPPPTPHKPGLQKVCS